MSAFVTTGAVLRPRARIVLRTPRAARPVQAARSVRRAVMAVGGDDGERDEGAKTFMERENDGAQVSVWGVLSFGIIMAIFAVAVAATLARDFVPGGLVP